MASVNPVFGLGILAGYVSCRLLPNGRLGVLLACISPTVVMTPVIVFLDPSALNLNVDSRNFIDMLLWISFSGFLGLVGYGWRRWMDPLIGK